MQLSTKESSQNGTDIYASLMSRHLLPALCEALNTESPLCKTHTNSHGFLRMTQPLVSTYLAI